MLFRSLAAAALLSVAASAAAAPAYHPAGSVPLGSPDRWDYVVVDGATGRVYVAHGDQLAVVDGRRGKLVGAVTGIAGGTHGTGIVGTLGVTDDGKAGEAVVFDPHSLAVIRRIPAGADADGIAVDASSGRILVADGDAGTISFIDPRAGRLVKNVPVGEAVEYLAVADGHAFVAGKDKGDVIVLDAAKAAVTAHWAMPDCVKPHGLVIDPVGHRVFVGCINTKLVVLDTRDGHVVTSLPIGPGSDSLAWDPLRHRLFSANGGDGTITVIEQRTPDRYVALDPITTRLGGRNMAVDPATGRLFVAAADLDTSVSPRRVKPGSLALLMFDPN